MIRYADGRDFVFLRRHDRHIGETELRECIGANRVLILLQDGQAAGWLRFQFFWDQHPFLNMLHLLEVFRGQGHGRRLMRFWEREMQKRGCSMVLTSTRSDERAQGFYRKLGYRDCGALLLPEESLEIILFKKI